MCVREVRERGTVVRGPRGAVLMGSGAVVIGDVVVMSGSAVLIGDVVISCGDIVWWCCGDGWYSIGKFRFACIMGTWLLSTHEASVPEKLYGLLRALRRRGSRAQPCGK